MSSNISAYFPEGLLTKIKRDIDLAVISLSTYWQAAYLLFSSQSRIQLYHLKMRARIYPSAFFQHGHP